MEKDFAIIEQDESGNVVASYGQTIAEAAVGFPVEELLDRDCCVAADWSKQATKKETSTLAQRLVAVFLPAGFPASVTDDYVGYAARGPKPFHSLLPVTAVTWLPCQSKLVGRSLHFSFDAKIKC
jgi:hypothetical protein